MVPRRVCFEQDQEGPRGVSRRTETPLTNDKYVDEESGKKKEPDSFEVVSLSLSLLCDGGNHDHDL